MCWTHRSVNLDETLNWKYFIKIWTDQLKMVDGTFFGLCKNFIFSQFKKWFFRKTNEDGRVPSVISPGRDSQTQFYKTAMSLESVNPWYRWITYAFGSNWTIFQNRIWLGFLLWVLWQGKGCIDQVSNGPGDCLINSVYPWFRTISIRKLI